MISLRELAASPSFVSPKAKHDTKVGVSLADEQKDAPSAQTDAEYSAENRAHPSAMAKTMARAGKGPMATRRQPMCMPKPPPTPPLPTDQEAFRHGFAWLHPRIQTLTAGGWTRPELYRRNRSRRGIAWLALWADSRVTPELLADGSIRFHIQRPGGQLTQTARPLSRQAVIFRGN